MRRIVPLTLTEADEFVRRHHRDHRHHPAVWDSPPSATEHEVSRSLLNARLKPRLPHGVAEAESWRGAMGAGEPSSTVVSRAR